VICALAFVELSQHVIMQMPIRRQNVRLIIGWTRDAAKCRDQPAGFLHQKRAGKSVPRTHIVFEKRVQSPASHVGKRQSRRTERAHGARDAEEGA